MSYPKLRADDTGTLTLSLGDPMLELPVDRANSSTQSATPSVDSENKINKACTTKLDEAFSMRNHDHQHFFKPGRLFEMNWTEGASKYGNSSQDPMFRVRFGQLVFSAIRLFLVIQTNQQSCICVSLIAGACIAEISYGLYTINGLPTCPERLVEARLQNGGRLKFDDSMIDFSRPYTIEMNLKVKDIGRLEPDSLRDIRKKVGESMCYLMRPSKSEPDHELNRLTTQDSPESSVFPSPAPASPDTSAPVACNPIFASNGKEPRNLDTLTPDSYLPENRSNYDNRQYRKTAGRRIQSNDKLSPKYKVVNASRFFESGRVIKLLWSEPASQMAPWSNGTSPVNNGELAFSKPRPFIVIAERPYFSICVPIYSYGGRRAEKDESCQKDHVFIYSSREQPPKGFSFAREPIPIIIKDSTEMRGISLINFTKLYTVPHDVKLVNVGIITDASVEKLRNYSFERLKNI